MSPKFSLGTLVEGEMYIPETGQLGYQRGKIVQLQATMNKLRYMYTVKSGGQYWETPEWRLRESVAEGWEPKESR